MVPGVAAAKGFAGSCAAIPSILVAMIRRDLGKTALTPHWLADIVRPTNPFYMA